MYASWVFKVDKKHHCIPDMKTTWRNEATPTPSVICWSKILQVHRHD